MPPRALKPQTCDLLFLWPVAEESVIVRHGRAVRGSLPLCPQTRTESVPVCPRTRSPLLRNTALQAGGRSLSFHLLCQTFSGDIFSYFLDPKQETPGAASQPREACGRRNICHPRGFVTCRSISETFR